MPFSKPHPLYSVWQGMKGRCFTPTNPHYFNYGGRGITVCERWKNSFQNFIDDMGPRPQGTTIDRINNDGNYEPGNCRWATKSQQQRNQRNTRKIVIEGVEYIAAELAEKYGFKTDTLVIRAQSVKTFKELVDKNVRVYKEGLSLGGKASGDKKRLLTNCKNGHEFNESNTLITKHGWRVCRECHRIRSLQHRTKKQSLKIEKDK